MFIAVRELRFARGRFALVTAVVALMMLLVGFLTGLTGGLAARNVSAVLGMHADRFVLAPPADGGAAMFADSAIGPPQRAEWAAASGVTSVLPVGIGQGRVVAGDATADVALVGGEAGLHPDAPAAPGTIAVPAEVAIDLGVSVGDGVTIAGVPLTVAATPEPQWYSHLPVVWLPLDDWRAVGERTGQTTELTALAVRGDADWDAIAASTGTTVSTPTTALLAIGAFRSEIGSLAMIIAMLLGISALVVGAFFALWTVQRRPDLAVLKALGASSGALLRDAAAQSMVVLVVGTGAGTAAVAGLGAVVPASVPFVLAPWTTLLPAASMVLLGLVGAGLAIRSITSVDPNTALGANR